jgi:hypothetical protein
MPMHTKHYRPRDDETYSNSIVTSLSIILFATVCIAIYYRRQSRQHHARECEMYERVRANVMLNNKNDTYELTHNCVSITDRRLGLFVFQYQHVVKYNTCNI